MRKTEKEKMTLAKARKEILLAMKLRQEDKERIDSIIEKEHFLVKKQLCSAVKCSHWKNCPFYRDPEDYERQLIKEKMQKTHCTCWSEHPNILEKLEKIHVCNPKLKIGKKIVVTNKSALKKDLQKQLLSFDKVLNEISERWNIQYE